MSLAGQIIQLLSFCTKNKVGVVCHSHNEQCYSQSSLSIDCTMVLRTRSTHKFNSNTNARNSPNRQKKWYIGIGQKKTSTSGERESKPKTVILSTIVGKTQREVIVVLRTHFLMRRCLSWRNIACMRSIGILVIFVKEAREKKA